MSKSYNGQKIVSLLLLFACLICVLVFSLQLLLSQSIRRAGIATLKFDTFVAHPETLVRDLDFVGTEILSSMTQAQSAAIQYATAVQSNVDTASTSLSNIASDEDPIPKNCSIGIEQFCLGFDNKLKCASLPFNLSRLLPDAVIQTMNEQISHLRQAETGMSSFVPATIQVPFILGLVSTIITFTFLVAVMFFQLRFFANTRRKIISSIVLSSITIIMFVVPVAFVVDFQKTLHNLSSVKVEDGDAGGFCIGAFSCAVCLLFLGLGIARLTSPPVTPSARGLK